MGEHHLDGKVQIGVGGAWLDGFKDDLVDTHLSLGVEFSKDFGDVLFAKYGFFPGIYPSYDFYTLENELGVGAKAPGGVNFVGGVGHGLILHSADGKTRGRSYVDSGLYGYLEFEFTAIRWNLGDFHITPDIKFKGGEDQFAMLAGATFGHKAIGSTNDKAGLPLDVLTSFDFGFDSQDAKNFKNRDVDAFLTGATLSLRHRFLDDLMFVRPDISLLALYPTDEGAELVTRCGVALGFRGTVNDNVKLTAAFSGNLQNTQESRTGYSVYESDFLVGAETGLEFLDPTTKVPDWNLAGKLFANQGAFSGAVSVGKYF